MSESEHELEQLVGHTVVLDVRDLFTYAGTLVAKFPHYLVLEDADVHDLRDTATTRELYVLELKKLGIHPNRKRVFVRLDEIISLSTLADVLD